ncbi:shikimate kinase [Pradoshia sp. D12]|uniref:shikimate kinase n=1 Tax=Bacillaceae TaxID=186817 RepID=UPI00112ECAAC|nr:MULTISPECIES: shikimate kinase [Bacillaceae]QFK72175.1 shikimate kinase [Pradoshia sp. D12]TPF71333.1 shikimate kinase [Bacillus sp. D12]
MKAIYLIGFMGAGKTTVGRALAEKMQCPFYDSDQTVVERTGRSIPQLFDEVGEDGFRDLEQQALQSLPIENCIIATGGGIILREDNRKYMKGKGTVIWLHANPTEIIKRLETDSSRPLLSGNKEEQIVQLYQKRVDLYKLAADLQIHTDRKTKMEITEEILMKITIN